MKRISGIDDVLFPVSIMPAGAIVETGATGTRFVASTTASAIVDASRQRVVGIVGAGYNLVTNQQALQWARECGPAVFPGTRPDDWVVMAVAGPASGSYCRIDVAHRDMALNFATKSPGWPHDAFGPFIRVTNSYNGQRALRFDIGVVRLMCSNGLILMDGLVSIRFPHSRTALPAQPKFTVAHHQLDAWLEQFDSNITILRECSATSDQILELVCAVLRLGPPPIGSAPRRWQDWQSTRTHLKALIARYVAEVGENAYAAFNVLTDFATRPAGRGAYARECHTLQARAGAWFSAFSNAARRPGFAFQTYLAELRTVRAAEAVDSRRWGARAAVNN